MRTVDLLLYLGTALIGIGLFRFFLGAIVYGDLSPKAMRLFNSGIFLCVLGASMVLAGAILRVVFGVGR